MLMLGKRFVHSEVIRLLRAGMNVTSFHMRGRQGDESFCILLCRSILASAAAPWGFSSAMRHSSDLCVQNGSLDAVLLGFAGSTGTCGPEG